MTDHVCEVDEVDVMRSLREGVDACEGNCGVHLKVKVVGAKAKVIRTAICFISEVQKVAPPDADVLTEALESVYDAALKEAQCEQSYHDLRCHQVSGHRGMHCYQWRGGDK